MTHFIFKKADCRYPVLYQSSVIGILYSMYSMYLYHGHSMLYLPLDLYIGYTILMAGIKDRYANQYHNLQIVLNVFNIKFHVVIPLFGYSCHIAGTMRPEHMGWSGGGGLSPSVSIAMPLISLL